MSWVQTINTLALPINSATPAVVPPEIGSDTICSASPAGLTDGVDGALTTAISDAGRNDPGPHGLCERQQCFWPTHLESATPAAPELQQDCSVR